MLKKERGLREDPIRLYLQSETGYLNIDLFSYIMEEFTKRWKITRPGLDCFMICDNLSVHRSDDVVTTARLNGIHLINISSESLEGKGKGRAKSTDPKNKEKPIEPPQKRPRGRPRKNVQDAAK